MGCKHIKVATISIYAVNISYAIISAWIFILTEDKLNTIIKKITTLLIIMIMAVGILGCEIIENGKNDDDITVPERVVSFSLWDTQISTKADMQMYASAIKEMGYDAIDITFRWTNIEYKKDFYDFKYVNDMLDIVKEHDLLISVSLMYWSVGLSWRNDIEWQRTIQGNIYEYSDRGASPSFSDEATVNKMMDVFEAFVENVINRYGKRVFRIHARTSQYGELEFFCGLPEGMLDYGEPAIAAFKSYIRNKYLDFSVLAQRVEMPQGVLNFNQLESLSSSQLTELLYYDWQIFRQNEVIKLAQRFQNILKGIDENVPFAIQVGCFFDANASDKRGLFDPYLASKVADIIHTDDGPNFPHDFSLDYIDVSDNVALASEIDGFWHPVIQDMVSAGDKSLAPYVRQARMSGEAGIKYLNTANWGINSIREFKDALSQYPVVFLNAIKRQPRDESIAILINTCDFIYKKRAMTDMLQNTYNHLSGGNKKVRFVTDTQLVENPHLLNEITTLYIGNTFGQYHITDGLAVLLKDADISIKSQQSPNNIVLKDNYGIVLDSTISNIIKSKISTI